MLSEKPIVRERATSLLSFRGNLAHVQHGALHQLII